MPIPTEYIEDLKKRLPLVESKERELDMLLRLRFEGKDEVAVKLIGSLFRPLEVNFLQFTLRPSEYVEEFLSDLRTAGVEDAIIDRVHQLVRKFSLLEEVFDISRELDIGLENTVTRIQGVLQPRIARPGALLPILNVKLFSHSREVLSYTSYAPDIVVNANRLLEIVANAHDYAQKANIKLEPNAEKFLAERLPNIIKQVRRLCQSLNIDAEKLWQDSKLQSPSELKEAPDSPASG